MDKERIYMNVKWLIEKKFERKVELEISDLQFCNDGFSNDIAMFNLKYYTNQLKFSKEVVYKDYSKSYKGNNGATKYKKELAIFKNYTNNKCINVPEVYLTNEEKTITIMEKIGGVTLDKIYANNYEIFNNTLKIFGESLAYIHSLDFQIIQKDIVNCNISPESYFNNYIESLKNRILVYNELEYLYILDLICHRFKDVNLNNLNNVCLNHGDYHFWNVLLTDKDKLFVLDWEKAKITDYRYDIANTLVLCYSWFGIDFKKYMLDGYINVTGKDILHLDCFEALKSFDSFTSCIPLIQGEDDSHIRDRSFMWVKRRYELFVENNGMRIKKAEEYLKRKGLM